MEALATKNVVAWAIVVLVLVLILKLLQSAGKGLMLLIVVAVVAAILFKFFPGLTTPITDFVGGSWMR